MASISPTSYTIMNFAKIFEHKRYNQIVIMKKQNNEGAPELCFFFNPEGYGICSFSLGWNRDISDQEVNKVFQDMVPREAIELVDGYMQNMQAANRGMN